MTIEQNADKSGKVKPKRPSSTSLEDRVKQHPDFAKWEALAGEVETANAEDALAEEHRATASEEGSRQVGIASRLIWLRRFVGADAEGFNAKGEHLKKPKELAQLYKVEVETAEAIFADAKEEIDAWLFEKQKRGGFDAMKMAAEKEIDRLENQLEEAA